jgi:hypothetical protein
MRRPVIVSLLVAALAACGGSDVSPSVVDGTIGTLAGVGELPEPLTELTTDTVDATSTTASTIPRSTVAREAPLGIVGERVEGNRLIIIGDSITASTARRYGGEMCFTLLPLGWAVEVNAEVARFVDFGTRVLDRRLRPESGVDWDAAVVFLGSNYGGDADRYRAELHQILDRLAPRPTVLVTVTEFRANRAGVNEVIRDMVDFYPEVQVLDWAEITGADRSLLSGDGLHLSADGRARLAGEVAMALGPAPAPDPSSGAPVGECLSTSFTDDSAGRRPGAVVPPTLTGSGGGAGGSGGGGEGNAPVTTSLTNPAGGSGSPSPTPVTVATTVATTTGSTAPSTVSPTVPSSESTTTPPPTAVTVPSTTESPATTEPPATVPDPPPPVDPPPPDDGD